MPAAPEEAVTLRYADCHLPGSGWGMLRLATATPRTAAAWTSSGTSHEQHGLKHRPDGTIRMVPAPPVLAGGAVLGAQPHRRPGLSVSVFWNTTKRWRRDSVIRL